MSDTSARLSLPYLMPSQAQKHVTHNEALRQLDVLVQTGVETRSLSTPPLAPNDGDVWIVAAGGAAAWAGQDGALAAWQDGAWMFYPPQTGWVVWLKDSASLLVYDGSDWTQATTELPFLGINATADLTNRLAVSAPASLFTNEGAGHQVKVNKSIETDTASLLFQTAFTGHAEMGLLGDNHFGVKVSDDGIAWANAMSIAPEDGHVGLGTIDPKRHLHVAGTNAMLRLEDPDVALGSGARSTLEFFDTNGRTAFLGFNSASNKHFAINVDETGSDIRLQGGQTTLTVANGGGVGIGTNSPATELEVIGDIQCTSLTETSDARLKTDVIPSPDSGPLIDAMDVVSYNWADGSGHVPFGMIAQDIGAIYPAAVRAGDGAAQLGKDSETWALRPGPLVALLLAEVQSLRTRVAQLEAGF